MPRGSPVSRLARNASMVSSISRPAQAPAESTARSPVPDLKHDRSSRTRKADERRIRSDPCPSGVIEMRMDKIKGMRLEFAREEVVLDKANIPGPSSATNSAGRGASPRRSPSPSPRRPAPPDRSGFATIRAPSNRYPAPVRRRHPRSPSKRRRLGSQSATGAKPSSSEACPPQIPAGARDGLTLAGPPTASTPWAPRRHPALLDRL